MNPHDLIRLASLSGIALNIRGGELYATLATDPQPTLVASLKEHKPAIIAALHQLSTDFDFLDMRLAECADVSIPSPLAAEAEALAADMRARGGIGQFVNDLHHTWNGLTPDDRAAATLAWQLAAGEGSEQPDHGSLAEPVRAVIPRANVAERPSDVVARPERSP